MNLNKKMLMVVNPGVVPSVTFVTCYEAAESGDRAETAAATPSKSKANNWIKAITHLPVAVNRLVQPTLKRPAFKSRATA